MNSKPFLAVILISVIGLTGCSTLWQGLAGQPVKSTEASSLLQFLYPDGNYERIPTDVKPKLKLPLRVGLAFVPTTQRSQSPQTSLSEKRKQELLQSIRAAFSEEKFVADIELIPEAYLRGSSGFTTIDQVGRLYDLDVITLVSYDQVAHIESNSKSLMYWTLVGAYFINGTENEVHTFVDAAVIDVKTHKLLFRAGGVAQDRKTSKLTNLDEVMRDVKSDGFEEAMADLANNLGLELKQFQERVRNEDVVQISYGGGGSMGLLAISMLFGLLLQRRWQRMKS